MSTLSDLAEPRVAASPGSDPLMRAAWLYYVEGMTQADVGVAMGLPRARVIALLALAREQGAVRVHIGGATASQVALERALRARYALAEVVVTPAALVPANVPRLVGHAAGRFLLDHLAPGVALAVGWGATLHAALKAVPATPLPHATVTSLLGGAVHARAITPFEVARHLADLLGARCYALNAPLVVSDAAMRDALWRDAALRELRERARNADVALLSVGDVSEAATLFEAGLVPAAELASLRAAGAVGDVLGHFVDAQGRRVAHALNERVMAVDLDDLAHGPQVALVAGGARKVTAIAAALRALPVHALVTDETAARGLLRG